MNGAYSSPLPFGLDFCRSNNTYRGYMPVQCCFFDRVQRDISVWGRGKPPEAPFAGTNFSNAFLKEVEFIDCNLSYATFSMAELDKVTFKNCNLKEASFYKMNQKKLQFENCNLEGIDVFETNLEKIDIRTCNINHIKIDIPSMKGLIVNETQALALAKFLQITIE